MEEAAKRYSSRRYSSGRQLHFRSLMTTSFSLRKRLQKYRTIIIHFNNVSFYCFIEPLQMSRPKIHVFSSTFIPTIKYRGYSGVERHVKVISSFIVIAKK